MLAATVLTIAVRRDSLTELQPDCSGETRGPKRGLQVAVAPKEFRRNRLNEMLVHDELKISASRPDMGKLSADPSFQCGEWLAEPRVNRIRSAHKEVTLEPRVMELLAYLAERAGEVVSAEDLLRDLWHGRVVGDDSIYQSIAKLRKALGDSSDSPKYIATIPKRGYTLTAPVRAPSTMGAFLAFARRETEAN